jgi:dihydroflavonol-4-reductase
MKAFVTGGTGFIGKVLVRKLVERGYQVNALVRSKKGAAWLQEASAHPVWGDITASDSMREGLAGCDVAFHMAAWYQLGGRDWQKAELINVEGTRNVLGLAHKLGIPKIIYTSTVAVYGDTHGKIVDETYVPAEGSLSKFLTEYDRTKWIAHYQVALPMIQQGAPIIIVMPGAVYGPGDSSLVGDMMRTFYYGMLPILPGPELSLTYAHVDDVAEGHILAAEKGQIGQSYHLTGPALSMREAVRLWAEICDLRPPLFSIPARFIVPLAPVADFLNHALSLPPMVSKDTVSILDATYLAGSDKARRELGWQTRPLEEGFCETFEWIAKETPPLQILPPQVSRKQTAAFALSVGAVVMLAYLWLRRRK